MEREPMYRLLFLLVLLGQSAFCQEVTTLANVRANGDVTVAANGDVYVADFGNPSLANGSTVVRITPDGQSSVFASNLPNAPAGVHFDSQGNLIQASFAGGAVNSIAPDGTVTFLGGTNGPVGVAVDDNDDIFIAACNRNVIVQLANGFFGTFATSSLFSCPNGITIGHDGALYVVNFSNPNVLRVGLDGSVSIFATTPGSGNGHIEFGNNSYYLTGRTTHTIYALDTSGNVSVVVGTGVDGNADGPADVATISRPNGIGISPDGRFLYIAGNSNFSAATIAIRKIDLGIQGEVFAINTGISGAWANPDTLGQGFLVNVFETVDGPQMFIAWFTYDTSMPPANETDGFGSSQHRWFTAQGPITDDQAEMTLFLTSGGIFDDPTTPATEAVGTLTMSFSSCTEGQVSYTFDADGRSNETLITRVTPDELCETLVGM
jgi:sugar lactone lactonase YvrE